MSRLKQLIREFCPNGVKYKKLGEIAEIGTGSSNTNEELSEGLYPFFVRSQNVRRKNSYEFDETAIITSGDGVGVGKIFHYIEGKYALHQRAYRIHIIDSNVIPKYFYYYMMNSFYNYITKNAVNSSVTSIRRQMLIKFPVPVPPLEVQNEIVRLLDRLTIATESIKEELNKEIVVQKKQYQYYRDLLLNFDNDINISDKSSVKRLIKELCPNGVEFIKIKELFYIKNGYTPSKSNSDFWENGNIPWFRMEDIRENGRILSKSLQCVTKEAIKGNLFSANSIIIATSATIGEHALITVDFLANQRFTCLTVKEKYKNRINPKFIFYYCFKLDKWCIDNVNLSNFASVDMNKFKNFRFPLPPIEVQNKIVEILDRFNTLANDITCGLPAEIELQKKRYEYFRDLLLTFDDCTIDTVHGTERNGTERW